MPRKQTWGPKEAFQLRQLREAGVELKEAAAMAGMSVATACRALASLRKKLGPEKYGHETPAMRAGHRARAHLYSNTENSQKPTSNTSPQS